MKKTTVTLTLIILVTLSLFWDGCSKPTEMAYTVHYYNWSPYSAHFYQIPDHCAESNKVVSNGTLCVIYSTNIKSAENIGEDPYKQTFAVGMSGNTILTLDYEFSGAANGVFDKVIVLSIYYDGKKMWYTD